MTGSKQFDRHAKLVDRMATAVGVDVEEAVQRGDLPGARLRETIYTCIGCSSVDDCEHWLEAHGDGADTTPAYCRNTELFRTLAG